MIAILTLSIGCNQSRKPRKADIYEFVVEPQTETCFFYHKHTSRYDYRANYATMAYGPCEKARDAGVTMRAVRITE